jgi:uncharacterized repeat protein (TIGR03803 family)
MHTTTRAGQPPYPLSLPRAARRRALWLTLGLILFSLPLALAQEVLMGLTSNGGPDGRGTAFSMTTAGANFSVVKGFADWGASPQGDLVQGTDGNFYGMTQDGGTLGAGTIFRVTPEGTVTILRNFDNPVDGGYPRGGLIEGTDGAFYGMTNTGGPNNYGTLFKITASGTYTVLKSLVAGTDGGNPQENLIRGNDGSFYGMTYSGGANGYGTIFRYNPATNVYTVLYSFNNVPSGRNPYGSLAKDNNGILYGLTNGGGTNGIGTVFKIDPATKAFTGDPPPVGRRRRVLPRQPGPGQRRPPLRHGSPGRHHRGRHHLPRHDGDHQYVQRGPQLKRRRRRVPQRQPGERPQRQPLRHDVERRRQSLRHHLPVQPLHQSYTVLRSLDLTPTAATRSPAWCGGHRR